MKKLSRQRHQANIRNAQRSTGPVTAEGKRRSALNALDHGLTAQSILLPGESDPRFRELISGFEADFVPQSAVAQFQVQQLAVSAWRILRAQTFEKALVRDQLSRTPAPGPNELSDACTIVSRAWADSRADLANRYEASHQRTFRQHYDRLLALESGDPNPGPPNQPNQQDTSENNAQRNEANASAAPPAGGATETAAPDQPDQHNAPENEPQRNEANASAAPPEGGATETASLDQQNQQNAPENGPQRNEANTSAAAPEGGVTETAAPDQPDRQNAPENEPQRNEATPLNGGHAQSHRPTPSNQQVTPQLPLLRNEANRPAAPPNGAR